MKTINFILKIVLIALICFLCKHLIQAIIEYTAIIPVKPRAYVWKYRSGGFYFGLQFVFGFWAVILFVYVVFVFLSLPFIERIKTWKLWLFWCVVVSFFALADGQFQFPMQKLPLSIKGERFNYIVIEDFVIYAIVGYLLIYLLRKWLVKNNSYLQLPNLNKP